MSDLIVGIDLGTTNSEIAAYIDGKPQVIGHGQQVMLPSCVGISPDGKLLIGETARNQMLLYPERTVRSIKRLMGTDETVTLGERTFSPQEISALILRELAAWAEAKFGQPVRKAVITVPAYFSDAQRNATREAGELAGLEVVRIVNEPTAASLAYGLDHDARRTVMVYDLGGGTLDVSIVRIEGEVTEVLASHGNNRLGGDDFDQKLLDHLLEKFRQQHGVDLRDQHPGATARLWWAAEAAKKQLSQDPYARVREEALVQIDGRPLNLDVEISREEYEAMIRPLLEETLGSASRALSDAGLLPAALDQVLLVGGSTRTPLVVELLEKMCGKTPRQDLHPDLCVALGAGVLASRLQGHDVQRVLVDVSPYTFGISYLGDMGGMPYPHCFSTVIRRNTPLPVTRTERYYTSADFQKAVDISVYQGEDPDALKNVPVGNFRIEGLRPIEGPNEVLCRMRLDLDGILHVTAIEKQTGLSKHVAITGATRRRTSTELARGRDVLARLYSTRDAEGMEDPAEQVTMLAGVVEVEDEDAEGEMEPEAAPVAVQTEQAESAPADTEATTLVTRCRAALESLHADDQEEALNLIEAVTDARSAGDSTGLQAAVAQLREFLFFVEGR